MKRTFFFIIIGTLLFSCGVKQSEAVTDGNVMDEATAKTQLAATPKIDLYSDGKTKLIKEANFRFEVKSVKESTQAIEIAVKKYPAYISSSSITLENPLLENKMTIRIQNEYFNELLQEVDKQAIFVNVRKVETEDVSKEFVDLDSRLKSKREVEARYMIILRNKAGSIEELLQAEKEIGILHEEIEATVSRINYLKDEVRYSTINLEFYQPVSETIADNEPSVTHEFSQAFTTGLNGVVKVSLFIVYLWPILVIATGIAFFIVRRRQLRPR